MGFTALHILIWLLTAFTLTTSELLKLSVNPKMTAECGKQVTLNCDVSSSREHLSIKHMEWSQNKTSLCFVDVKGKVIKPNSHDRSDFHCEYQHGQLSLVFQRVQPLECGNSKPYRCKLQSNQGAAHGYTTVELQECCGTVNGDLKGDGPSCTFSHVYPDGDVHWFHGSKNLSDGSLHHTTKHVDKGGWLTIRSHLRGKSSDVPYNCSLRSTASGRYIESTLVHNPEILSSIRATQSGAGSQGTMRIFLCISVLLAVTLI
ncbi:uncharacterized protein [Pempheris klunzingeri]|uniref:uncharacterized protein n=1 Tax=Pempheris klunzingeri TaxID=3127111 RepID=UPI003980B7D9